MSDSALEADATGTYDAKKLATKTAFFKDVNRDVELTASARALFGMLLFGFHNTETGKCNPSTDTLVDASGMVRSTVFTALRKLEDNGVIARVSMPIKGKRGHSNWYTFAGLPRPSEIRTNPVRISDPNREGNREGNRLPLTPAGGKGVRRPCR